MSAPLECLRAGGRAGRLAGRTACQRATTSRRCGSQDAWCGAGWGWRRRLRKGGRRLCHETRVATACSTGEVEVTPQGGQEEAEGAELPKGLRGVKHMIAVASCKGGVGKSTTCVNLAYTLSQMGAKVGIFDADVYGPSLPIMVSPDYGKSKLVMDPETKEIAPVEYENVKLVSFGFTTEGSAIMRGPMAGGLVNQLLTTTNWGDLDYLLIDMPPGTGDIHLTIGQAVPIACAVVVTTPHKLAYADVAKGIRMFARLDVPCVSVVENMSYFDGDDGKRYFPFGKGSGEQIQGEFAIPHLVRMPIKEEVSSGSDEGVPCVVSDPLSDVAGSMQELGASVIKEVTKMGTKRKHKVKYDPNMHEMHVSLFEEGSEGGEGRWDSFEIEPLVVRKNDQSAKFIDQLTGEPINQEFSPHIFPLEIKPLGNYAVQINWSDGFNQIATYDQLRVMERIQ
ncbi:iron-sulfur cluster carrier protein [Chloropicon primus]|uniref:Iron-sulfur cluster carrier protein n=1 Tax=Chloropicon primus TaxID=1764295 RepID=A0A5B8MML0_9CHLO|nr:iron-sulfur cluster carrier protein [Chloropicon primus]UPR00920.1 iron-sulfur cluster carrier protein [Chloropicon primus]|eukprot:QDZ21699.1 iron-sulfur cluster carrier protein [Chloropicon primus]